MPKFSFSSPLHLTSTLKRHLYVIHQRSYHGYSAQRGAWEANRCKPDWAFPNTGLRALDGSEVRPLSLSPLRYRCRGCNDCEVQFLCVQVQFGPSTLRWRSLICSRFLYPSICRRRVHPVLLALLLYHSPH
ncbi:uncharacterized protein EI90DRAFT_3293429 [Cantharellus anzutake]|uniref:uncharacterized protein n=1 Tax=Cantharellus anzutake TaxID=1750568 RepID=UPI0019086032|nr:uncharacterized protein EI90DRAFT_3294355 [Cantharellus anzutake]XP_038909600.1 uncharacterized protein EI90DRAFT_3293429 [Cantharellus anzutake]KAF8313942.1 hypothetical protein EI90DRAFT_3294355 [Cantharellus anzutake]KAF8317852.1 hypothetical protein EI90DRAFT_3293429 [Cantharellus anzutake]